jgi:hypothetical protein
MGATEAAAGRRGRRRRKRSLRAEANQNANLGNSTCANWCHENLAGKAAGQCTAAAAKGEGPCYECGPAADPAGDLVFCEGSCGECCGDGDCCSPQVCGDNNQCVIACGTNFCDPKSQKCCVDVCIPYDRCCTFGQLDVCLASTNADNIPDFPYVEEIGRSVGKVTLKFWNPTGFCAFFEYRIDDERLTCGDPHLVITGDWEYPGVTLGNCPWGQFPNELVKEFDVEEKIEVRHALGGENDWFFESNQSSWAIPLAAVSE